MKSPYAARALAAPIAAHFVLVGRIIEQIGKLRLRNGVGSGMIKLACNDSGWFAVRSRNVTDDPVTGSMSVSGVALPALSCQVWKCCVSVGPILSRIRKTSRL